MEGYLGAPASCRPLGSIATATSGTIRGVWGKTASSADNAAGVLGEATAGADRTGRTLGVWGRTKSPAFNAAGVFGEATALTGSTAGAMGQTASKDASAAAVYGVVYANDSSAKGVWGETNSPKDGAIAVYGNARGSATSNNFATGVKGQGAFGVYGVGATSAGSGQALKSAGVVGVNPDTEDDRGFGVFGSKTYQGSGISPIRTHGAIGAHVGGPGPAFIDYSHTNLFVGTTGDPVGSSPFEHPFLSPLSIQLRFRVDGLGKVFANGGYATGGADVAEHIPVREATQPGDVVEIDPKHAGQFRLAARPNSPAVAGVISTDPALSMNLRDAANSEKNVGPQLALVGRVPVKVSAENGPIVPGDLLVSSSTPGHAMRAPEQPAPGTVIGKALGPLEKDRGQIEMLIMLR